MGKLFGNLTTEGLEKTEDKVGGGFQPLETNVYDGTVTLAYAGKSQGGAHNVTVHIDINGHEHRETIYITNRNGENFYKDQKTGKPMPLPGYSTMDDLALFTTEEPLSEQDSDTKTVKLYNFDEKKEMNTEVEVLTGMLGQSVKVGLLRVIEDKNKKEGDRYVPTGETFTKNEINKVFHPDTGRTINEYKQGVDEAVFMDEWLKANRNADGTGKDRNKAKGAGGGGAGASGSGRPGGESAEPKKKLFS